MELEYESFGPRGKNAVRPNEEEATRRSHFLANVDKTDMSNTGRDKKVWGKVFNTVDSLMGEGSTEDEAWETTDQLTKGNLTRNRYDKYLAGIYEYAEEETPVFEWEFQEGVYSVQATPETRLKNAELPRSVEEAKRLGYLVALNDWSDDDDLDTNAAKATALVAERGPKGFREQAQSNKVIEAVDGVKELIGKGVVEPSLLEETVKYVRKVQSEEDEYIIEKKAVAKLGEMRDRNPAWKDLRLMDKPILTKIQEERSKEAVIRSWLDRKAMLENYDNPIAEFIDDTGEFVQQVLFSSLVGGLRTFGLNPQSLKYWGEQIKSLPIDEIPAALDKQYDLFASKTGYIGDDQETVLRRMTAGTIGTQEDIGSETTHQYIEAALALPIFTSVKLLNRFIAKSGNAEKVATDAARVMQTGNVEGTVYNSIDDVIQDTLPFSVGNNSAEGVSAIVTREMDILDAALTEAKNLTELGRLKPEEIAEAISRRRAQLEKLYGRKQIHSSNVVFSPEKGVFEVDMLIGKQGGAGFATEGIAESFMVRNGMSGTGSTIIKTESGWMIKQVHAVTESLADSGFQNIRLIGRVKRFIQAPKAFVDDFLGAHGTAASHNEAYLSGVARTMYDRYIGGLPSQDFKEIAEILNVSLERSLKADTGKWFTVRELQEESITRFSKELSDKQISAYYAYQKMSDFAHFVDNRAIYKAKAAKGLETVKVEGVYNLEFDANVYATVAGLPKIPRGARFYNAETKAFEKIESETLKDFLEKGYVLVRPEDPSWTIEKLGEGASYILTKGRGSVKSRPLDFDQLPYTAGGRREYTSPFFIGQQSAGKFTDGTRYLKTPRFFRTAKTEAQAKAWVSSSNTANAALSSFKKGTMDQEAANAIIQKSTGKSLHEWDELATAEGWDINSAFKFKRDRGEFPVDDYDTLEAVRMYSPESLEATFGTRTPGRLSTRGSMLKDVNGDDSQIFDALGALTRNVDRAIAAGAWSDFKMTSINRFNTSFRKYIKDSDRLTPYEIVTKGAILDSVALENPGLYNAIKAHQFYIKSLLRTKGSWDATVQHSMDKLARWIEKGDTKMTTNIAEALYKGKGNPVDVLRGINFDLNLGMFNPAQFLTQVNSVVVSVAMSPRHGFSAFKESAALRYALIANDPYTTAFIAKQLKSVGEGMELGKAAEQFKRLGFNDFGSNLSMIDAQSSLGATSSRAMGNVARARETGRFFFKEGERASRLTAYGIARRKYKDLHREADEFSREADSWIREETDRILLSPNADNNAFINKGLGGIPTQFWSYMMKLSDAMFTGSGGRYTGAERARVAGAQVMFYGASGMPFLNYMLTQYEKSTGTTLDPEVAKLLHNGIIDTSIYIASGGTMDTNFSGQNGIGGWWTSLAEDLTENPIVPVLAGPVGTNMWGAWQVMQNTARVQGLILEPTPEAVTMTALAGVGSLVKSLSKATQAIVGYNTGIWYDKYGRSVAEVSKGEAIVSLIGLAPQAQADVFSIMSDRKAAQDAYVNEITPIFQRLHERYMAAETDKEREHIQGLINAMSSINHQTGWGPDVIKRFTYFMKSPSLHETMRRQLANDVMGGKKGVNSNYLSPEQKRQITEENE